MASCRMRAAILMHWRSSLILFFDKKVLKRFDDVSAHQCQFTKRSLIQDLDIQRRAILCLLNGQILQ